MIETMLKLGRLDKNGSTIMAIYCWNCSGHRHANMRRGKGKGYCVVVETQMKDKELRYKFRCITCKSESMWQGKHYVRDYAVR